MYRQGDVLLVPATGVPAGAEKVARDNGRLVLALGEATGHAHAVETLGAELFSSTADRYLKVPSTGASLVHEEHGTIKLPEGTYKVVLQREYTPQQNLRVCD
jgi:hypothetical protein